MPTSGNVAVGGSILAAACLFEFILAAAVLVNRDLWARLPVAVGSNEGLGRKFVLRSTTLIIGRQAVAKVLPCFPLDQ
jgi:hypothetical protein